MTLRISKSQIEEIKSSAIVGRDCHVFSSRNDVYGGYIRNEHWYNKYYASASDTRTREPVKGSLLMDDHPLHPFSRLTGEQPSGYIGVGAIVYLTDCFNFGRVAEVFGYTAKVEEVISRKRSPYGEMKLHPLTITKMSFGYSTKYTLTDQNQVSVTLNDGVCLEPCILRQHQAKVDAFHADLEERYAQSQAKKQREAEEQYERTQAFQKRISDHCALISIETKLWFGTDIFEVREINDGRYFLHHWRSPKWVSKVDLLDYKVAISANAATTL